jgi:hypothetical protein
MPPWGLRSLPDHVPTEQTSGFIIQRVSDISGAKRSRDWHMHLFDFRTAHWAGCVSDPFCLCQIEGRAHYPRNYIPKRFCVLCQR